MSESKNSGMRQTGVSHASSDEQAAEFWDTHSLADHWDQTYEVDFEVRAQRHRRVTIDPEVFARVEAQARVRGVSPETLVNLWLAERLHAMNNPGPM
ncbi:MAG: BrnA antitoxin family protein [Chloroflexi bacterium]|nr:BrnA antitoxin family protein [Chloroflexota bacterium]